MTSNVFALESDGEVGSHLAGSHEDVSDGVGVCRRCLSHHKPMLVGLGAIAICFAALALLALLIQLGPGSWRVPEEQSHISCRHPVPATLRTASTAAYVNNSAEVCGFKGVGQLGPDDFSVSEAGMKWQAYAELHGTVRSRLALGVRGQRIMVWHCLSKESCGGIGDQVRGLTTALFAAMETDRALFIKWWRDDLDLSELLHTRGVDWRLPSTFSGKSCAGAIFSYTNWTPKRGKITEAFMDFVNSDADCVAVLTNLIPEDTLNTSTLRSYVQDHNNNQEGCAMRFLFSFEHAYSELGRAVQLCHSDKVVAADGDSSDSDIGSAAPWAERYVAVHLRFGDRVFQGHQDKPELSIVRDALFCAVGLGRDLFNSQHGWGILFASDSVAARGLALGEHMGVPVFTSSITPVHSNAELEVWGHNLSNLVGEATVWSSWGDQLLLSRAHGLVQCFDLRRQCYVSGFSQLAANVGFIPLSNMRIRRENGCVAKAQKRMTGWYHGCRQWHCPNGVQN